MLKLVTSPHVNLEDVPYHLLPHSVDLVDSFGNLSMTPRSSSTSQESANPLEAFTVSGRRERRGQN